MEYVGFRQLNKFRKSFGSESWEIDPELREALSYDADHEERVWKEFEEAGGYDKPEGEVAENLPKAFIAQNLVDACHVFHAYCPYIYDWDKSQRLIIEALERSSSRFKETRDGLIPLIYTTLADPSADDLDKDVWKALKSLESFHQADYGHIDIDCALSLLADKWIVKVQHFNLLSANQKSLTGEFYIKYDRSKGRRFLGVKKSGKQSQQPEIEYEFSGLATYDDGLIRFNGQEVDLRFQVREICRYFLSRPKELVTFDDLAEVLGEEGPMTDKLMGRISRYVSELRRELKPLNTKIVLKNYRSSGWIMSQ